MEKVFEIYKQEEKDYAEVVLKNLITGEYISVIPSLGARLNKAVLKKGEKVYSVLRELETKDFKSNDDIFNNVKLFPFANRLENGTYFFEGQEYNIDINYAEEKNACHGFVFNENFHLIEQITNYEYAEAGFLYDYYGDKNGYPFTFKLYINYKLSREGNITCSTKAINTSKEKILFSDGWHPYFTLNDNINELVLELDAGSLIKCNESGIPTGEKEAIKCSPPESLRGKTFDTLFKLNDKEKIITTLYNPAEEIKLTIWQQAGINKYGYLMVYTPPDRKSIAIEPMTSNINAFNNKENIIYLNPGIMWKCEFGFKLD